MFYDIMVFYCTNNVSRTKSVSKDSSWRYIMTYEEMYDLILKTGEEDERIRAVTMEGSNVTPGGSA